jgi:hypothetical protein
MLEKKRGLEALRRHHPAQASSFLWQKRQAPMEFLPSERIELLICSSHADQAYLEQMRAALSSAVPAAALDVWDEARLAASGGHAAFARALKAAKLALLLLSPETLGPQYLTHSAVLPLLDAASQEGFPLLGVVTRPCDLEPPQPGIFNSLSEPVSAMTPAEQQQFWEKLAAQVRDTLASDALDATVLRKDVQLPEEPEGPERLSAGIDWDRELESAYKAVHGAEALLAAPSMESLHFLACSPASVAVESWGLLLVYPHIDSAVNSVYRDAARYTEDIPDRRYATPNAADQPLPRGVELTIVPQGQGLTFNPPRLTFNWLEDWQQVPFRLLANSALVGREVEAEITMYAGAHMLATIKVPLICRDKAAIAPIPVSERDEPADGSQPGATCFRCGTPNPPGRRFCIICNYDLAPRHVPNLQSPQETWLPFIHARLTLLDNPLKEQHFNLHELAVTTIGRAPGNDIILSDPSISRHHAQLRFESGRWIIEDTASSLGTYVNGRRIRWPQPLADGDQLRLAHTFLLFSIIA